MKGAIFDIDGTLLESTNVWLKASQTFFKNNRAKITVKDLEQMQSLTFEESFPIIQKKYIPDLTFESLLQQITDIISYEYKYNVSAKQGAADYLCKLHLSGIKIAVATSNNENLCHAALKRLDMYNFIDTYAYSSEVKCGKSSPDVYILAANRLSLNPNECTVFEDLPAGIKSASEVGFKTVAVADSSNISNTVQLKRLADMYIENWNELI